MRDEERCVKRSGKRSVQPALPAPGEAAGPRSARCRAPPTRFPRPARPPCPGDGSAVSVPSPAAQSLLAAPAGIAWGKGLGGRPGCGQMDG